MLDWDWLRYISWLCRARRAARCHGSAAEWPGSPAGHAARDPGRDAARHGRAGRGRPAAAASLWRHASTAASAAGLPSTAADGRPCRIARQPCPANGAWRPGRACCTAGIVCLFLASGCLLSLPSCASSWMIWFLRRAVPSSGNPAKQTETPGWLDWHPMRRPCHIASGTHHDIEIVPPAVAATPDATGSACVASAAAAGCSAA